MMRVQSLTGLSAAILEDLGLVVPVPNVEERPDAPEHRVGNRGSRLLLAIFDDVESRGVQKRGPYVFSLERVSDSGKPHTKSDHEDACYLKN